MLTGREAAALTESEPQPCTPHKFSPSLPLLPPEIYLLIAKSLAPSDQLHLGLTCKSLFFLTAPKLLGEKITRHSLCKSKFIHDTFYAGFANLELYEYLLELHSGEFNLVCRAAGRRGNIEKIKSWSSRYKRPIPVDAAVGASEAGNIAFLEWALEHTPPPAAWDDSLIFHAAARNGHEDALNFLHSRFSIRPRWLSEDVRAAARAGHIDLALKLFRRLPLCCSERIFTRAGEAIARSSIEMKKENWRQVLAQFLETPSTISDAVGLSAFVAAASQNRVDVLRYVDDESCTTLHRQTLHQPLGSAIAYGSTEAFDYICQAPDWTSVVDDAIENMPNLIRSDSRAGAFSSLIRHVMPHIKNRSTFISLICHAAVSDELLNYVAKEFCRRFESPSQDELEKLYLGQRSLEDIKALAEHFPPRSTAHANEIARYAKEPANTIAFLRQFCPDIDPKIQRWPNFC